MSSEIITKDDARIIAFFKSIERMLDGVERLATNHKPHLNGERFLTDREVSDQLKLSRRTLQDYRTEGKIPYIHLGGQNFIPGIRCPKITRSQLQQSICVVMQI